MFIPRSYISHIANFVNHGRQEPKQSGFTRDGIVGGRDPNKPTYFYNGLPHNGTDFCLPEWTPIRAWKNNLKVVDILYTDDGGLTVYLYDKDTDRLYGFTHCNDVAVEYETLDAGRIIAYSGSSGKLSKEPHIHLSIYNGDKPDLSNLLDPLLMPEFQDILAYIPYNPAKRDHAEGWLKFQQNQKLYINGVFEHLNKRGEECVLQFTSNQPIKKIYHTGKTIFDSEQNTQTYFYGTEFEITKLFSEIGKNIFETAFIQQALPGIYYFQAKTPSGFTVPARILVI